MFITFIGDDDEYYPKKPFVFVADERRVWFNVALSSGFKSLRSALMRSGAR